MDEMMKEISEFIGNVGFPVGISTYMIIVVNKSIATLTEAVTELKTFVESMKKD